MIRKFYVDNFRCLQNFLLELDETNVLLGANGTGKTSVFAALRKIQNLVVRGAKVEQAFPTRDISFAKNGNKQHFAIDVVIDDGLYQYALTIEHDEASSRMRICAETLDLDGKPLFAFKEGKAQLYHDDHTKGPSYPFDWSLSGIGILHERPENKKITCFKREITNYIIVSPCPPLFETETKTEDEFLDVSMCNFVSWYRQSAQENMGSIAGLFSELSKALPSFQSIRLTESGENARVLKVVFEGPDSQQIRYGFEQLSDGQRALIALYGLIFLSGDSRISLFIDEPDNYLALREIQPWLATATEHCGKSLEQIAVISHHPVVIDYMAGTAGRWFFRQHDGPVRVSDHPQRITDGLSLSEIIARGWEE